MIKPRGWGGDTSKGRILSNGQFVLYVNATNSCINVSSDNKGTNAVSANSSIALGTSYIVAITRKASDHTTNIYINGVLSGTADQDSGAPATGSATVIGNNSATSPTAGFDGDIDDIIPYNKILTATQLTQVYKNLKAEWGL